MEAELRTTHERDLLGTICDYKLTPAQLMMPTTLFYPKEFGGCFFFLDYFQENLSTVFIELI